MTVAATLHALRGALSLASAAGFAFLKGELALIEVALELVLAVLKISLK